MEIIEERPLEGYHAAQLRTGWLIQYPVTTLYVTSYDYLAPGLITHNPEEPDTVTLRK